MFVALVFVVVFHARAQLRILTKICVFLIIKVRIIVFSEHYNCEVFVSSRFLVSCFVA